MELYVRQAEYGNTVIAHFTGTLENGEVFESTKKGQSMEFTIGSGDIIIGFQKGIVGMEVGEKKTIKVPPVEAYGPRYEELILNVKRDDLPEHISPVIGKEIQAWRAGGNLINLIITDIDRDTVTLDANHPLAGRTLIFYVELIDIKE